MIKFVVNEYYQTSQGDLAQCVGTHQDSLYKDFCGTQFLVGKDTVFTDDTGKSHKSNLVIKKLGAGWKSCPNCRVPMRVR